MANYNLGTARGVIELVYKGGGAVNQASGDIAKVSKSGELAHKVLKKLALATGTAVVTGFVLAIKSAADFEKGMSGIQAVSGATAQEMEQVRAKALQLGADTAFSAMDAAGAIEELVKAGIPIADVMAGAADATVALAAAGGIDLPQAATIAANAMNQFGLSAAEMPLVADKIAGAANASAIDVADFGQSLTQVGAVAHLAGLSFSDTALAITAMGNAGIKGSDAGTSLKSFLQRLQPTTKAQTVAMKELGLITKDGGNQFFTASGKIKSMSEIAGTLKKSLAGMTDQQKTSTLQTLFGTDAIRAAAVIAGQGSEGFAKLGKAIDKVKAADVAKTRMDNFSGSMEQLKGSLETVAIQFGSALLPALRTFVDGLTVAVNSLAGFATWLSGLPAPVKALGAAIMAGVAAWIAWHVAMRAVGMAILFTTKAVTGVGPALAKMWAFMLANPIGIIIALIAALVVGFIYLWNNSEGFRNFWIGLWAGIQSIVASVVGWFTGTVGPAFAAVWAGIQTGLAAVGSFFTSVWNGIVSFFTGIWASLTGATTTGMSGVSSAWTTAWSAISSFFNSIWTFITTAVSAGMMFLKSIITSGLTAIQAVWSAIWGVFGGLITAVWELIKAIIMFAIKLILFVIRTNMMVMSAFWGAVWNAIAAVARVVWAVIKALITAAVNGIRSVVMTVFNAVRSFITSVWNGIRSVSASVWSAIRSAVTSAVNAIRSVVSSVFNAIRSVVSSVWNAIRSLTSSVWNAIKAAISGPINAAKSAVSSAVNGIRSVVSSSFNAAKSAAIAAFNALKAGVSASINAAKAIISSVVGSIKGIFSGAAGWLLGAGKAIVQGLINGITSMIGAVTSKLSFLTNLIPDWKGPPERDAILLRKNGQLIMQGLIDGIMSQAGDLKSTLGGLTDAIPSAVNANVTQIIGVSPASALVSAPTDTAAGGDNNYITVQIDPSDLAGLVEVERFVNGIRQKARMSQGVNN